jgi:hypothetical protein
MKGKRKLSPRRALMLFLLAMAGSLTGGLGGRHVVAAFQGSAA